MRENLSGGVVLQKSAPAEIELMAEVGSLIGANGLPAKRAAH
jgi:hypothetical protein